MAYKYFTKRELRCSHCNQHGMNEEFMSKVEILREQLDFPTGSSQALSRQVSQALE